jgi:hypothetical protein
MAQSNATPRRCELPEQAVAFEQQPVIDTVQKPSARQ